MLNALLFDSVESCGYSGTLQWSFTNAFTLLSLINLFGCKNAFFVEIKIYVWLIDSSRQRVHSQQATEKD